MVEFEITKHIATINDNGYGTTLELNLVRWNGRPEKWDIRRWGTSTDGVRTPLKGISLAPIELDRLGEILLGAKGETKNVSENTL